MRKWIFLLALLALPSCGSVAVIGLGALIGFGVFSGSGDDTTEFAGVPFGFIRGPERFTVEPVAQLEFLVLPGTIARGRIEQRMAGDDDWSDWEGDERDGFFPLNGPERAGMVLEPLLLGRYRFTLQVATEDPDSGVFTDMFEWTVVPLALTKSPRNLAARVEGESIVLAWDPPPFQENVFVAGYRVYYGTDLGSVEIGGVVGGTPLPGDPVFASLPVGGTGAIAAGSERDSPALVGPVLSTTLVNLDPCTRHYFAVTAIDAAGVESEPTEPIALRSSCGPNPVDEPPTGGEPPPGPFVGLDQPEALVAGDFDGDGRLELAVAERGAGSVRILRRDPAGRGFSTDSQPVDVDDFPVRLLRADFDEDEWDDLLVAHEKGGVVYLRGLGGGDFERADSGLEGAAFDLFPSLAAFDLAHDSVIDVVAIEDASGGLRRFLGIAEPAPGGPNDVNGRSGRGTGRFDPASTLVELGRVVDSTMADFDADGHLDLALSDAYEPLVHVLRGDGAGGFDPAKSFPVSGLPGAIAAADLDSDGVLDLAVANRGPLGQVSILIGTAHAIGFARAGDHPVGTSPSALVAADVDLDGAMDLVVANRGSDDVSFLMGIDDGALGSGEFFPQLRRATGDAPADLVVVDWDGDKLPDVITVDAESGTATLLLGGGMLLQAEGTFRLNRDQIDRYEELLEKDPEERDPHEFDPLDAHVRHFMFDAPEGSARPTPDSPRIETIDQPVSMVQGDYNGDGLADLAVLLLALEEEVERAPSVALFAGTGVDAVGTVTAPSFADPVVFSLGTPGYGPGLSIVTGEFDSDGIADLAVGRASQALTLLRGVGEWGRGAGIFEPPELAGIFEHTPSNLVVADLDRDSILDLIYSDGPDSKVQSMIGAGDGRFDAEQPSSVNPRTDCGASVFQPVLAADFNEDGVLDYASVADLGKDLNPGPPDVELPSPCGQVHLLLGRTEGPGARFVYSDQGNGLSIIELGSQTTDIVTADFDRDGILDLAVTDGDQHRVYVLLGEGADGHGNAQFRLLAGFAVGRGPGNLLAFDANQDGLLDLATGNRTDGTVSVLLGDGSGSFAPFVDAQGYVLRDYWIGEEPVELLSGDYNRDTLPDLAVAVRGDAAGLRILLGAPR